MDNIKNINMPKTIGINKTPQRIKQSLELKPDTFERTSSSKVTPEDVSKSLSVLKVNNKPKMSPKDIDSISKIVQRQPQKWEHIKTLANNPAIESGQVATLASLGLSELSMFTEIASITNEKNEPRFTYKDLYAFRAKPKDEFDEDEDEFENDKILENKLPKIKELSVTKLYPKSMAEVLEDEKINIPALVNKVKDIESEVGDELQGGIYFRKNAFDSNNYEITADLKDYGSKNYLLDKDLNVVAKEKVELYFTKNKKYQIVKTNDYRNNTVSKVRMEVGKNGKAITTHEVRVLKDKNGKKIRTEYMEPSEVKGVFNVKREYSDGKVEKLSEGIIDKQTGEVIVKKKMPSLNGTQTDFLLKEDKNGNRTVNYKITDKDNKVLYEDLRTFEVLGENKFKSTTKNTAHEIVVNPNNMVIKNLKTQKESKIAFISMFQDDKEILKNLLKRVSGEELEEMKNNVSSIKYARLTGSQSDPRRREITTVDDLYTFLHEIGHSKDYKNLSASDYEEIGIYSNDEEIQNVYKKEKEAFNEAFPNAQREHINYFINQKDHYRGEWGGLSEVIGEANALLQSHNTDLMLASRSQYLQQYFPETIACVANKMQKN